MLQGSAHPLIQKKTLFAMKEKGNSVSEFSLSVWNDMVHTAVNTNLILMDPCIVDYSVEISTRCNL
jgi:hypothetical protein